MKLIPNIFDSILIEEKSNRHEALERFHQQQTRQRNTGLKLKKKTKTECFKTEVTYKKSKNRLKEYLKHPKIYLKKSNRLEKIILK